MPANAVAVTANYEKVYTVTITAAPTGGGTASRNPDKTGYAAGENVTVTATAANGYAFAGWSGASTATTAAVTVTIDGNKTLTANFTPLNTLTVSVTPAGGGTVSRNPDAAYYATGASVTVTATAASGYTFKNWSGASTSTGSSVTITISGNTAITANFAQLYTLTTSISPAGAGVILRNPDQASYTPGASVIVTAAPTSGYVFAGWSGSALSKENPVAVILDGNKTLVANFAQAPGVITAYSVTDSRDEKTYPTVMIGGKRWMAQNLNYTPPVGNSWCNSGSVANCNTYGRLYDWNTAMAGAVSSSANPSGVQGVCPAGWHLPSRAEWGALVYAVGGDPGAGKKLMSTIGWSSYTSDGVTYGGNGTDDYGFSALPGNLRRTDGSYNAGSSSGYWWTATEYDASTAYLLAMYSGHIDVNEGAYGKEGGLSVRCVAD
jgi:uncharacterized protein (TIGR02145 family)/uncharacterized repeat protein (TIGR02543 family)